VIWGLAYALLLAALFVRFQDPAAAPPRPNVPLPDEPLALLRWHHRLFYALLLAVPLEAAVLGGRAGGRWLGGLLFATGVWLYRRGGRDLGTHLSPFVLPRRDAALVRQGLYARVRHPMYLGHLLIALGAPLMLGARWAFLVVVPASIVLFVRLGHEEAALRDRFPSYAEYATHTKRLVPFLW
jgi:protein-S-isoprenylcysteine O-methyltransferase Ste14